MDVQKSSILTEISLLTPSATFSKISQYWHRPFSNLLSGNVLRDGKKSAFQPHFSGQTPLLGSPVAIRVGIQAKKGVKDYEERN